MPVLSSYLVNAIKEANYKLLEDGSYYCDIKKCPGVWANEETLEQCRSVLQEVLEEWLLLKLRDYDPLPQLGGIDLNRVTDEA
ncbi:MAG: type II toxin-antitoxin system HicB family antitoxin [Firmicutes bacterium]|nr:type II toxin-antitoxin system HicB family antitoxin [Bacillota bacterium]